MLALDLKAGAAEVQEESKVEPGGGEVVHELRFVRRKERRDRLVLDDDTELDYEVSRKRADDDAVIHDIHRTLAFDPEPGLAQFMHQRSFIDGLEKTRS